ncbi:MAG: ATP-binding cassette domain-containing protein, partial [Alphaproteobacteria bacterium]
MNARVVAEPLVAIEKLTVRLPEGGDRLKAVDGIDLDIAPGRILCVVGESGSGKSMTAHAIMGLVPKPLVSTGTIRFDGENLIGLAAEKHRAIRGRRIGMIF